MSTLPPTSPRPTLVTPESYYVLLDGELVLVEGEIPPGAELASTTTSLETAPIDGTILDSLGVLPDIGLG